MSATLPFAETLSDETRRHCRRAAIASTLSGCISTQLLESNAALVLFLTLLGGSESIAMFSSSIMSLSGILLLIPCAAFAARWGLRFTYGISCFAGFFGFCLIAAAPFFGAWGKFCVICGCFLYTLTLNFYSSTWYPLLDNILRKEERVPFFSKMRFIYMLFNACLLFLLGKMLGAGRSLWVFQGVFLLAGIGLLVRKFCMDLLPINPAMRRESPDLRKSTSLCLHNSDLLGFSAYLCCLYFAFSAALPLTMIYMKVVLNVASGTIMTFTAIHLLGKLSGFFLLGRLGNSVSMAFQILFTHILALFSVGALFFLAEGGPGMTVLAGTAFFFLGMVNAFLMCISAVEMLFLATPGNKIMAIAFCSTFISLGTAGGTLLTAFLLKKGYLKGVREIFGMTVSGYQLLPGICFLGILLIFLLLPFVPAMRRKKEKERAST